MDADVRGDPEDIAEGPDPDTDPGPEETEDDVAEADRLLVNVQEDSELRESWDLKGVDD